MYIYANYNYIDGLSVIKASMNHEEKSAKVFVYRHTVAGQVSSYIKFAYRQRWAKVTTLRVFTIFLEALFQLEKRLEGWTGA
jgi:hypothetical protein